MSSVMKLWRELHGTDVQRTELVQNQGKPPMKLIYISVAFTGVEALEQGQQGIQGFFNFNSTNYNSKPNSHAHSASDPVSKSMGSTSASTSSTSGHSKPESSRGPRDQSKYLSDLETDVQLQSETLTYKCPTCSKMISTSIYAHENEETRTQKLESLKAEHEDFHFAQQLAREQTVYLGGSNGGKAKAKSKSKRQNSPGHSAPQKKQKTGPDISSYFQKK